MRQTELRQEILPAYTNRLESPIPGTYSQELLYSQELPYSQELFPGTIPTNSLFPNELRHTVPRSPFRHTVPKSPFGVASKGVASANIQH
jgi:hypothetical protein